MASAHLLLVLLVISLLGQGSCAHTSGGEAPATVLIGGDCTQSTHCVVESSRCVDNKCSCDLNFVASADLRSCHGKGFLGEPCEESAQCEDVENAECHTVTKMCECATKYIAPPDDNSKCNRLAEMLDDTCREHLNQCSSIPNTECIWYGGDLYQCQCVRHTYVSSGAGNKCLPKQGLGGSCEETVQCNLWNVDNSECDLGSKTCVCRSAFINPPNAPNKCVWIAQQIGEGCNENRYQCQNLTGAFCQGEPGSRICDCFQGYVSSGYGKRCLLKADFLGDSCEESTQCQANLGQSSVCLRDACHCEPGYEESEDMTRCIRRAPIGDYCEASEECVGLPMETSWCSPFSQTCECMEGFVSSWYGDNCFPIRQQLNETCVEDVQCTSGPLGNTAACVDGRCGCRDGFPYIDGQCRKPAGLGEVCRSEEECKLGNEYSFCGANDPTHDYRCKCIPGAVETPEGSCYLRRIGDGCETDDDCKLSIGGEVECDACNKVCWCKTGHLSLGDLSSCASRDCLARKVHGG